MNIVDLSVTVAMLLIISLATERLVVVLKTVFPRWLADEKTTATGETDLVGDRGRRLWVQVLALAAAWATAGFLTTSGGFNPIGEVDLGTVTAPVWVVALLASGGSAFWAQVLGYTSAVKDIANARKVATTGGHDASGGAERDAVHIGPTKLVGEPAGD